MATVTGYTAQRMQQIEDESIVDGNVVSGELILVQRNGTTINAGNVRGPQGDTGTTGGIAEAPTDDIPYSRRNGAWVPERAHQAPSDNRLYALRNGTWTRIDRPWKLEFSQAGPTPPAGFSAGTLASMQPWDVSFSGYGNTVTVSFTFVTPNSSNSASPRFQLPSAMRPITDLQQTAYIRDLRSGYIAAGTAVYWLSANGQLTGPRGQSGIISTASIGSSAVHRNAVYQHTPVEVRVSFTYVRASADLPANASYV